MFEIAQPGPPAAQVGAQVSPNPAETRSGLFYSFSKQMKFCLFSPAERHEDRTETGRFWSRSSSDPRSDGGPLQRHLQLGSEPVCPHSPEVLQTLCETLPALRGQGSVPDQLVLVLVLQQLDHSLMFPLQDYVCQVLELKQQLRIKLDHPQLHETLMEGGRVQVTEVLDLT